MRKKKIKWKPKKNRVHVRDQATKSTQKRKTQQQPNTTKSI